MSNYITIERGYFLPFKKDETDPELKAWTDKYFEIINKINETLLPYENSDFYYGFSEIAGLSREKVEMSNRTSYDRLHDIEQRQTTLIGKWMSEFDNNLRESLSELEEELRVCLLHRIWRCDEAFLINESNIVIVKLNTVSDPNMFSCHEKLVIGTGVWETDVYGFDYDGYGYVQSQFSKTLDGIKVMGVSALSADCLMGYLKIKCQRMYSDCSIQETYKDFQSNNIEKIKKDKIKCGNYEIASEYAGIQVIRRIV